MLIVKLLLPFPFFYTPFFFITSLSLFNPTKILGLLLSCTATFKVLLISLLSFLKLLVTCYGQFENYTTFYVSLKQSDEMNNYNPFIRVIIISIVSSII